MQRVQKNCIVLFLSVFLLLQCMPAFASDSITAYPNVPVSVTVFSNPCSKVTNNSPTGASLYVPTTTTAEWQSFTTRPPAGVTFTSCATNITVPCTTNVNLFTLAGSPSTPGTYIFTIPSGCVVGSNTTSLPALTTGNWPAGSSVTLINNGYIEGMGGAGGGGGNHTGCFNTSGTAIDYTCLTARYGTPGGAALKILTPITIKNSGVIYGGGGGGGGGMEGATPALNEWYGGGGGGGGQGFATSSAGSGGTSWTCRGGDWCGYNAWPPNGSPGRLGNAQGAGSGGFGAYNPPVIAYSEWFYGGNGGYGGQWGMPGTSGDPTAIRFFYDFVYYDIATGTMTQPPITGASGGAAGPAITGSAYGITWVSYGDVRGPVQ